MKTNKEVVEAWAEGRDSRSRHVYTDGITIWSYGPHFPLATKLGNNIYINADKYSATTGRHKSAVKCVALDIPGADIGFTNTEDLKTIITTRNDSAIRRTIYRKKGYNAIVKKMAELGVTLNYDRATYGDMISKCRWVTDYNVNTISVTASHRGAEWLSGQWRPGTKGRKEREAACRIYMSNLLAT